MPGVAARRWAEDLAAWAIPAEILDRAPESPWGCPPALFAQSAADAVHAGAGSRSPSNLSALEALPAGGSVLDVGVGGGAASLPLVPEAGAITGVDESAAMLGRFAELAERLGVAHQEVEGSWPAVAGAVPVADVAVCHHVAYNVGDLPPFLAALAARARRRVVLEVTVEHPQSVLNELWRHFHGLTRPTGPTVDDLMAVLAELGIGADIRRWELGSRWRGMSREDLVAFARRRLCLPAARDAEVAARLDEDFFAGPRRLATIWWDPGNGAKLVDPE